MAAEEANPVFETGETVVIREDFHSKYFRGMKAIIAGPAIKGGTADPLWPLKIDKPPYQTVLPAKYFRRASEVEADRAKSNGASSETPKKGLLSRLMPWKR